MELVAQIISALAVTFFVLSIQNKEMSKILLFQLIANLLYALSYGLLGIIAALFMNLVSSIRCVVFYEYKKRKKEIPKYYLYVFIGLIILFGLINYKENLFFIPIIITSLYIISSYQKDTNKLRIVFLICSIIWFYYNFRVGAYVILIGNVFEFISGLISLVRYKKLKKTKSIDKKK